MIKTKKLLTFYSCHPISSTSTHHYEIWISLLLKLQLLSICNFRVINLAFMGALKN